MGKINSQIVLIEAFEKIILKFEKRVLCITYVSWEKDITKPHQFHKVKVYVEYQPQIPEKNLVFYNKKSEKFVCV